MICTSGLTQRFITSMCRCSLFVVDTCIRSTAVNSVGSWCKNVTKKALALGVPYMTFTIATWVLKKVFSSSVNDQIGGLGETLFLHPTAPYWYLYALFFIFLVTPTFSSVKATAVGLIVALAAKVLILTGGTAFTLYRRFSQTKSGLCSV